MRPHRRRGSQGTARQRGSLTLEAAIVMPLVIMFVFAVIEGAMWYHARNVALGAAQQGARAAAAQSGADGTDEAAHYISVAGGDDVLRQSGIAPSLTATEATITVTGVAPNLIPFWDGPTVSQTATFPVERFTTPGGP